MLRAQKNAFPAKNAGRTGEPASTAAASEIGRGIATRESRMPPKALDYGYIFITVFLTAFGQVVLKWRIGGYGPLPEPGWDKLKFLLSLLSDPFILSGFAAAFVAGLAWMAAMTKFELSYAYPFMSLNFAVVLLISGLVLSEPITWTKIIGTALIIIGTSVVANG
jgi:drug/metabolite transporter (DMT)-like permease